MARKEGLLGRKVGMTQVFGDDGSQIPVTVIEAGPCTVVGLRTRETHGYEALQLGFEPKKKNVNKPEAGHFKKAGVPPMRVLREIRLDKAERLAGYQVGQTLTVEMFEPGELVDVVGVSKARASRAASSATAGTAATPPTARCSTARPDPSAPRRTRRACGRATSCPGRWAVTAARC